MIMSMKNLSKGFTLIELLITIAIIGILAATIIRSLNDARVSGMDAKIQGEMDGIAKRASIEQTTTGSYTNVCGAGQTAEIARLVTSIETLSAGSVVCNSTAGEYAASVELPSGIHWCVDSTGAHKEIAAALVADTDYACPS